MKKLFLLALTTILVFNCNQEQRYTQNSKEIDALKAVIEAYNNKDWAAAASHYADTSKTRFNNTEMDSKDIAKYHQQNDVNYSSRGFIDKDQEYEMVIDDSGKTWVNFWGDWEATLKGNGKKVMLHVHLTARFIDGKIVADYGYWDPSEIISNLQDIASNNSLLEAQQEE